MKNIRFKEIAFLSYKGVARRINLNRDLVVIAGGNETGKSCILKSLYYTLGASVHPFAQRWAEGNVISMLKFSVNEINFKAVRMGNDIYIFNPDNSLNFHERDRVRFAAKFGNLLGINISYKDSKGKDKTFTSGFMFMPFYLDQDKGWDQPLTSFTGLSGSGGKHNAILYHTGIINDEFYVHKSRMEEAEARKKIANNEIAANYRFRQEAMKRFAKYDVLPFTIEEFNNGIKEVMSKLNSLKEKQKEIMKELEKLYSIKYSYQFNIDQLKENIVEIEKDFKYALKSETELCCPMCGASVENDAFARFKMLDDKDRCKDLLIDNNTKLDEIKEKITEKEKVSQSIRDEIDELQERINSRSNEVTLDEMFEAKLRGYVEEVVNDATDRLRAEINKLDQTIYECKESIKRLQNNDKKSNVEDDFDVYVKGLLKKFGILGVEKKHSLGGKIRTTGSSVVKYVIAYTYAYLNVMQKNNCPLFAPIVIDEPKQKGIDDNGFISILNSIVNDRPQGSQLILSLTDNELSNLNADYDSIILKPGSEVMNYEEYEDVKKEVEELVYGNFELQGY